ncbi:MAG: aminotransferase class IV [Mariniphaga sp.]
MKISKPAVHIYEVIRVIKGIPVFLEDHLDRLNRSAHLAGFENLPGTDEISKRIRNYIASENKDLGNIKLGFSFSDPAAEPGFTLSFIPHYYPTPEEYNSGVKVGLIKADRPIPNAKIQHADIRERANQVMEINGQYEVLFVDSDGNITEGSRSNVFFIKDGKLYSAPVEKILQGITRIKVLDICKKEGIEVNETVIPANSLEQFEAAFLTGTSPKVLPICSIEKINYETKLPLLIKLQDEYNQLIEHRFPL